MRQSTRRAQRLRALIDDDLPVDELERLARVDALLRLAANRDRVEAAGLLPQATGRNLYPDEAAIQRPR